jgi:3-phenylpropionate/trans-cinnamate dioxygenase ferredoxin reductase subunit
VAEAGDLPLGRGLPAEIAAVTMAWWRDAGIDLRTGAEIVGTEGGTSGKPVTVTLAGGTSITADLVVSGVGVRPASDWLVGSGVALGDGGEVLTDRGLRTNVGNVVAVGDVAAWESRRYGRRLHVEHWDTALHGPVVAAANLLSAPAPDSEPVAVYDPVPYFWSQQFGRNLQLVGYPPAGSSVVWRGDPAAGHGWSVGWFAGESLVAVLAVDSPRDVRQAKRLLENGVAVDRERFADPLVPVKDVAAVAGTVSSEASSTAPRASAPTGAPRRGRPKGTARRPAATQEITDTGTGSGATSEELGDTGRAVAG